MKVDLTREYRFEAAHRLPRVPDGHKCSRLHGHSYRVELTVSGPINPETGWLMDFAAVDEVWATLESRLDHRFLNEVPGLENPTSENLAVLIWNDVRARIPELSAVTVWEDATSRCTVRG